MIYIIEEKLKNNFPIYFDYIFYCAKISIIPSVVICKRKALWSTDLWGVGS
jgi:hypothetical protein